MRRVVLCAGCGSPCSRLPRAGSTVQGNEPRSMIPRSPMRGRILLALCLVASMGACVNLDKPENVAECAKTGSCVNATLDAAPTVDTGRADKAADGKRDA